MLIGGGRPWSGEPDDEEWTLLKMRECTVAVNLNVNVKRVVRELGLVVAGPMLALG